MEKKLGFIGAGNMAKAMMGGIFEERDSVTGGCDRI